MNARRALTLLLLLCGLSTTPFFSLEQSTDDGLTASSVPQCVTRLPGKVLEGGASLDPAPGPIGFHGQHIPTAHPSGRGSAIPVRISTARAAPVSSHCSGTEGLPYHANAPPASSDRTS